MVCTLQSPHSLHCLTVWAIDSHCFLVSPVNKTVGNFLKLCVWWCVLFCVSLLCSQARTSKEWASLLLCIRKSAHSLQYLTPRAVDSQSCLVSPVNRTIGNLSCMMCSLGLLFTLFPGTNQSWSAFLPLTQVVYTSFHSLHLFNTLSYW